MMSEQLTILLATGWDTINIGDIGHTPGTLRVFEQYLPDAKVIAWMHRTNDTIQTMLKRRFPNVQFVQGNIDAEGDADTPELATAINQASIVVHNSSMIADTALMRAARKRGKPYGMFGQSYTPSVVEKKTLMDLLNEASFVYCRETLTLQTLQQAKIAPPVLAFNPDGCFGIDVRDDDAAEAFLSPKDLQQGRFMTIQLRTNTQKHPGTDSFLNPANPTPEQQADDERRAETFHALIAGWVKRTGCKVLIAPEVEKEIAHNKRLLMDPLPADVREHVVLREKFWNADEAASVFARASVTVCHEPHSCIIAMANGTPAMHIYSAFHSPKYHMFADIGVPEWLLPIDDTPSAALLERLLSIHAAPAEARAKVQQAMTNVHDRFAQACRTLEQAARRTTA